MNPRLIPLSLLLPLAVGCADIADENTGALEVELGFDGEMPEFWEFSVEAPEDEVPHERPPATRAQGTWVLANLEVAEREDSFDLDADGESDNALAAVDRPLRDAFADWLLESDALPAISADPIDEDNKAIGLCAIDASMDEVMGQSEVLRGAGMEEDGSCYTTVPMAWQDPNVFGHIDTPLPLAIELQPVGGWELDGMLQPDRVELWLGGVVPVDQLVALADAMGEHELARDLPALADFDTDGDDAADAISVGFWMTGFKVEID